MAINLPQGLYTAGAVPLDVSPMTNFANQLALKQQARQDSLNEYYQNINKSINPEGIRPQDTSGFMSKYNDFTNFYSQNRSAIQNPRLDGGKAQAEYNSRHLDLMSDADKSKQAQNSTVELWKAKSTPGSAYMFNSPDIIPAVHQNDLSIYDPNYKQLNVDELQANARPLGVKDLNAIHAGLMKGLGAPSHNVGDPIADGHGNLTQNVQYSPDEKQGYISRARQTYNSDPTVRAYAASIVSDPVRAKQASDAFFNVTGQQPQTEADLFAGEFAAADDIDKIKGIPHSDAAGKSAIILGRQKALAEYTYGQKWNLAQLNSSLTHGRTLQNKEDDYMALSNFANKNIQGAITSGKAKTVTDESGQQVMEYPMANMQAMDKFYHEGTQEKGAEPVEYRTNMTGDYVRVVYPSGKSKKIPKDDFVADLGKALPARSIQPVAQPTPGPAGTTPSAKTISTIPHGGLNDVQ